MKKHFLLIIFLRLCLSQTTAQQCLSGGCTSFGNEYPTSGAPYTPSTSWQVLVNPATGNVANFNGGNWTRFNVVSGNTYEWTYCEAYGGVSTSWDAQLTLSNNNSPTIPICFSTDVCGTNQNAPYISWTATFTGTVRLLTTAYISGTGGCQSNSSSPYNKLAYRQVSTSCTTPGVPSSANATPSGQTTANLSWTAGSPAGSSTVTYYWVVGTSSSVTYGNGVAQGSTTGTSATASTLACNTTYYLRVYAKTNCDNTSSGYKTSASFTTSACSTNSLYGVDVSNYNGTINWHQVYLAGKSFAYVKSTEGFTGNDAQFVTSMNSSNPDGVVLGPYHLARPDNQPGTAGAIQEANHFLSIAGSYIGAGYLPPALDMESLFSTSALGIAQWVNAWATTVQSSKGVWPVLYIARCDASSLLPYYQNGTIDSHIKLWIADTGNPAGSPANTTNCIWNSWPWIFHQYWWPCNACASNNPTTGMDLDIFNGDLTAFNNLINVSTTCSDQFESNNSANTATLVFTNPLNSGSSNYAPQGNIGFAGDQDWYRVNIQACGTLTVNLSNLPFNYDIELWNSSATSALSGSYNTGTSNEQVSYTSTSSSLTNVFIKVYANNSSNFTTASCYNLQFLWSPGNCPCTPPAQPGTISGTTTVCENGLHTYSISAVSGATGYTWTLPATWSGNGSTTTSINASVGNSGGTISVTANNSCGSSSPKTLSVTVNQLPAQPGTISGATTVCQGNAQTYSVSSVSGATGYTWSLPAGWSGSSSTNSISATPGSSGGTISVTANNSCGSSSPKTLSVSMGTLPAQPGNITGTATVCSGTAQTYSINAVSGATSYTWTYSGGGTPSGTGTTASLAPTSSGTLTVVANNSCGSSTQRILSITVNPLPTQPSAITGSTSVCSGTSQPYSISAVSGATSYTWSYSGGGTPSGTGTSVSLTPTSSGTLTVVANNSCGSSSQRTLAITVNSVPTQPGTITGNNSICSGTSQPYSISAVSGATSYTWVYSGSGSPSGTNTSISFSPTSSGTLSVVANNSCGSSSARTLVISVNQTPSVSVNPPSVSICSGGSGTTLQVTGSAQSYSWSPSTGLNTTIGQTVTANPSSNTTYTVTASNGNCTATATSVVTVSNQITASISPATPVICGNGSVSLSATPGTAYVWTGPNNFNGNTQTVSVSNGGSYSVTVTNPGGCVGNAIATITVTLNPALVVDAGANQVIQSGDSAQLGGSPTASGGAPPYIYTWNPTTALANSGASNPYSNPTTGSISYNLTVTDSKGCSANDNVSVTVSTGCQTYVLDSLSMNIPHDSATYSINLTTGAGCPWSLAEGCSWLSFTNTSGSGTAALIFTVEENMLTSPRTCYVNIEGNILIITQGQASPCLTPVSDFTASQQAIFAGNTVTFSDNSTNTPSQWEWTFNGGNPATSTAQNPTVTYSSGGLFDVTLKATNNCGNNTITKTNYINVIGTVGIDNIVFDNFISIYPNPNSGTFRIVAQTPTQKAVQLKLFSAIGQLVHIEQMLPVANKIEKDISVGNISAGVYLLQITVNNKPSYKKLIIE